MKIRRVIRQDLEEIRRLDSEAWTGLWPSGKASKYRTMSNLLCNWNDDPEGCFVAEHRGEMLGYIFSHICGSLGYIGTFGVLPDHRGTGVGQKLLRKSIKHLTSNRCSTIGLETRPENQYNVGLYLSHGFAPRYLTVAMEHAVVNGPVRGEFVEWNELDESSRAIMAKKFLVTCNIVLPGLNYVRMALTRIQALEGKLCAFGGVTNPLGFALVRTAPKFERDEFTDAFVEAMVVRPVSEGKFIEMVRILESLSHEWGKSAVVLPVTSSNWGTMKALTRDGFRVRGTMVRMLYREKIASRRCINLNSWAM